MGPRLRLIVLLITLCLCIQATSAGTIESLSFETGQTTTVVISGKNLGEPSIYEMSEGGHRVVIDFLSDTSNLEMSPHTQGQKKSEGKERVKLIRQAVRGEQGTRLVLDLVDGASLSSQSVSEDQVRISIAGQMPKVVRPIQTSPRYFKGKIPYPIAKPAMLYKPSPPPVIVIDPGHGGKDPGSVGQRKTFEKSVTMKSAKELKALLEASGRYKVYLTRSGDRYVDHDDRIKIARQKNADLFISIHADSIKTPSTRGASVYTLADRAVGRSKNIVNSQNWIMDVDLSTQSDPVGDILVDLAQRKTFSQSADFADHLLSELSKSTHLLRNSHRRAGYYVLLAPDVPAVLLELGFISNKQDEKLLNSARHRKKVLRSVKTAIDKYFDDQNP